jgi:surfeit locus 1 family protein
VESTLTASRRFHLSWPALIVALLAVAFCLRLGAWQLSRAAEKETLVENVRSRADQAPVPLKQLLKMPDPAHYPVVLSGQFDNRYNLLLDNRVVDGVAGYYLLTLFNSDDHYALLVNRGWLPRGRQRAVLPEIEPINGHVTITGHSYLYSSKTFTLAEDDLAQAQWPLRVQKVEMQAIGHLLEVELAPFEIRVSPDAKLESKTQLPRPWQDATEAIMGPQRHRAYALQWFALATMALVVFVAASFRKTA